MQDGKRLEGESLTDWHATVSTPQLDGKPLLAETPFRWLRDRRLTPLPAPSPVRVELFGGDCLPGKVVAFSDGREAAFEPRPAHFLVEPAVTLRPPQPPSSMAIRVRSNFVRRIVWEARQHDYQPATAFYRDGRRLEFRAIRFGPGHADVLSADGRERIGFGELAELHLPQRAFWQSYLEELATLSPDGQAQLLRVETTDGLRATSSLARTRVHTSGNQKDPTRWFHGLQPAWSLDMLWLPHAEIWLRCLSPCNEIPLSRFPPAGDSLDQPPHGSSRTGYADRNVRGGPLASGGQEFGWGLGVQADSRMAFDLPPIAESFQTSLGLDRIAGIGGCIRATVAMRLGGAKDPGSGGPADDKKRETELFASPLLVGSQQVVDSGLLPLPGTAPKRLVLSVDMAHYDRPAGADPLNIRDMADWLDPVVRVPMAALRAEIRQHLVTRFAAWNGWSLELPEGDVPDSEVWEEPSPSTGGFVPLLRTTAGPLVLRRQVVLGPDDHWLVVAASRPSAGPEVMLQVAINGEMVTDASIPVHDRRTLDYQPLVIPLADYQSGGRADIEIRQSAFPPGAGPADAGIAWRALAITRQLPMRYAIFEDDAPFTSLPDDNEAAGETAGAKDPPLPRPTIEVAEQPNSGRAILVVPKGVTARLQLPQPVAIRERPGWGEYRYLRIAIRKVGGGRADMRLQSADAGSPRRYDAGLGDLVHRDARRIWGGQFGEQWVVITRDLFGDFGPLDLDALDLATPDGQRVEFDQIYLARSPNDLQGLPLPPPAK